MPAVSVVITCFNYARYLPEAVASVQAQTLRDVEVIVIDDGSTDDSLAVAHALADGDPRIAVIAQENSGQPAIPRNRAIEQARAPYVLCLDADDRLGPVVLEHCAAVLDADARLGMAYGQQQDFGHSTKRHHLNRWNAPQLASHNIQPCTTLFRRDAWAAAGGYSTNVRGYEDWDLWLGITEAGYGGREVPGVVWHYRTHDGGVYKQAVGGDQRLKAQVVLNRAGMYGDGRLAWARAVLAGDAAALELGRDRAIVPDVADPPRPLRLSSDPAERADWHVAAEGLEGPWPGRDLAAALEVVDRLGYTAVAADGAVVARKWELDPLARAGAPRVFPGPFFLPGTPPRARAAALAEAFEPLVVGHRLQAPGPLDAARAAAHVGVPASELEAVIGLTTTLLGDAAAPVPPEAGGPVGRMAQVLRAERLLAGDAPGADRLAALEARARRAGLADARRVAVLAFGDELAADPGLLRAYGEHFGAEDDITLVIATRDPEAVVATVAAAGLKHDASPDMLAVPDAPAGVDAVLSRHAHGALPRVDAASVATLRALIAT
jgi:Glycosyl transferase family 2